jgi:hypothetical protein
MPGTVTQASTTTRGEIGTNFNCRINPADMVGIVDNLLERIVDLETEVARLKAKNTEVSYLDELGQQVGWVTGITYMGTEGWTRTSAGTLIPPPGWSLSSAGLLMSDGTPYQGVVMDENGVLQFGFTQNGVMAGAKVDEWDAAASGGAPDYYVFKLNDDVSQGRNISIGANSYSTAAGVYSGGARFTVTKEGLYLVNQSATWIFSGGIPVTTVLAAKADLQGGTVSVPTKWLARNNEIEAINSIVGQTFQDPIGDLLHVNQSEIFLLEAGGRATSTMTAYALPGANLPADIHFYRVNFSIVHLGTTA